MIKPPYALLDAFPQMRVFPIRSGSKAPPCFKRELELATTDRDLIAKWAVQYPGCNWGVALARSDLIVLDVDTKPGKGGQDTLERLELEHGRLPRTLTVQTPSGGLHFYFGEANGIKHRMRVSAFGRDIDSPNYTVLPGGVLSTGGQYEVGTKAPIAPAPLWFAEYLDAPMVGDNSQVPAVEMDQPQNIAWAVHYLRHDAPPSIMGRNGEYTLLRVAATLKDHGISEDMAIELLAVHYNNRCQPPWSMGDGPTADRLDVKAHNAWLYLKQTTPGSHTAEAAFGDDAVDAAALDALDALDALWKERDKAKADAKAKTRRLVRRYLKETVPTKSTRAIWKANHK